MTCTTKLRNLFLLLLPIMTTSLLSAQEVMIPLGENKVARDFYLNHPTPRKAAPADTVKLPFIDDFSDSFVEPKPSLWSDNFAFINNTYPVFPVTAGVATLDAYNFDGSEYPDAGTRPYVADYLTSQPIDLAKVPSDSIYLSFFFQPKGLGEMPDPNDSLCLEFLNTGLGIWQRVWDTPGDSLRPFRQVMIPVTDTAFLKKGFRFRFFNYASQAENNDYPDLRSNVDHWHIDYVYLNAGRNKNDTILRDVAFINPLPSILKDYESVPWSHLKQAYFTQRTPFIPAVIMNHDTITRNVTKLLQITDNETGYTYSTTPVANDLAAGDSINYLYSYDYPFDFDAGNSATLNIKTILRTDVFDYKPNDTLYYTQVFDNYYAYDDGTAEAGYGLRGQGTKNASVAVKFESYRADSLRAVDMYFNQVLDSLNLKYYFYLCVWEDDNGKPGNLIYNELGVKVKYSEDLNQFTRYTLEYPVPVEGPFYVGWTKTVDKLSNIGLDLNRNHRNKIFYNTGNGWLNTQYSASLMLRPVVSLDPLTGIRAPEPARANNDLFRAYPIPADQYLHIDFNPNGSGYQLEMVDITGRRLGEYDPSNQTMIYTGDLKPGVYFLILRNQSTGQSSSKKVIINH